MLVYVYGNIILHIRRFRQRVCIALTTAPSGSGLEHFFSSLFVPRHPTPDNLTSSSTTTEIKYANNIVEGLMLLKLTKRVSKISQ